MLKWQTCFLIGFAITNLLASFKGFYESSKKKNAYGEVFVLGPLGIFVWGDAAVFGIFWAGAAIITILLTDWVLFLLIFSLFWVVRSFGETIYWFNQQFSTITRVEPKGRPLYKYFHNDSVWFIYQICQQCITVVSLIFSLYFANQWIMSL
ncbi:hypothetical protein C4564_05630 [Candidatus Microgenomates bacterium]|nr:MAG: hypothetical protein C4564_05630 [Candidatus Microgenomates bacterium]